MRRPRLPEMPKLVQVDIFHGGHNVAAGTEMKTLFIFLSAAALVAAFSSDEGRVRRQIWPAPGNPNFFWNGPRDGRDFFGGGDFWPGRRRFDQPRRNQAFDGFDFGGGGNDPNRNGRSTTESLGPITSTPRTIHYPPQRCECPMTQQFNPVCGTDGNTYRNVGLLNCYMRCGSNVSQKRLGTC